MARITCPNENTPEFAELSNALGDSPLAFHLWRKNNYLPLDKIDVNGQEETNPLFEEALNTIAEGDRSLALRAVAHTMMSEFQKKYGEEDLGTTMDFLRQDLEDLGMKVQKRKEDNLQAQQVPNSIVLTLTTEAGDVVFNEEESEEIFSNLSFLSATYGPKEVLRLLTLKKEKIQAKIKEDHTLVSEAEKQQAPNLILLTKNWDTVTAWYKSQEPTFGLSSEADSNTYTDEFDQEIEDFTGGTNTYNKNAHDKGQKDLASAEVIRIVQSLPEYQKLTVQEQKEVANGEKLIDDFIILGSILGLPVTGEFSKNWNLLSASLTGITDYNLILAELTNLSTIYPQFTNLLRALPVPTNNNVSLSNANLAASFQQVMSMPEITAQKLSIKQFTDKDGPKYTTKVFELGTKTITNLIKYFDADYGISNSSLLIADSQALDLEKLLKRFTVNGQSLSDRIRKYFEANKGRKLKDTPEGTKLLNEIYMFHRAIGVVPTNPLFKESKEKFASFLQSSAKPTADLYDKLEASRGNKSITEPLSYLLNTQGSGKLKRLPDTINSIIKYYGQFEKEFASGSYLNPENKLQYNRVQYFYLTQISNTLNKVSSYAELISMPEFAHLDIRKNPNMIGSLWLEKMFGINTKKATLQSVIDKLNSGEQFPKKKLPYTQDNFGISIQNFSGVSIEGNHRKNSTTTGLTPEDKILQDFFSFYSQGVVENVRFGDKGTSYATILAGKPEDRVYFKLSEEVMKEKNLVIPTTEKAVVEQFTEYLKSEAFRLKSILNKPGKSTYHKNGKNLFTFKDILPSKVYDAFVNAETEVDIDAQYEAVKANLQEYLDTYFQQKTAEYKVSLMEAVYPDDSLLPISTSPQDRLRTIISRLNKRNFFDTGINKEPITEANFDYLISNYLKNDFIHKAEFFKMFIGDIANFQVKGDYREVFKRIPFTSSPGYVPHDNPVVNTFLKNSPYTNGLQKVLNNVTKPFRRTVRTVVFNDVNTFKPEDWEAYKNAMGLPDDVTYKEYVNNPKEADAQGLVTLDFYRNYLINISQWSQDQEDAYTNEIELFKLYQQPQSEERDEQIADLKDSIKYVGFPPLKLGHYGSIVEDPRLIALHKYSLAPLIPSMIQGTQLEQLHESMLKGDIDYATFQSGSKASNHGESLDFYIEQAPLSKNEQLKLKVNDNITDANVTTLHLFNLKQQQYIAPKFKNEATLATQMVKLLFGDFYSDGNLDSLDSEFAEKIGDLYSRYTSSIQNLVGIEKLNLYNKLGLTENPDGTLSGFDDKKFINFLKSEMDNRNVTNSLKRYIQVDSEGNLVYPLDAARNRTEIESIILSVINNRIISQKLHGEAYVQMASTGLGTSRFKKPTEAQIKNAGINGLRNYRVENGKTQPADVKIAFNPQKHSGLLKLKFDGKVIGDLDTLNSILMSDDRKEKAWVEEHTKKLTLVGVRIPVQGFNSMEHMRVRQFLPTSAGPIIVVPAGIVAKSGGDFDIDKLTMFEPTLDRDGNIISVKDYSLEKYKADLPTRKESVQLLKYLRQAKEELQSIISEFPNYQKSKEIQKEIQALKEDVESKESLLESMTGKSISLEELQERGNQGKEDKIDLIKSKRKEIQELLQSGEVKEALDLFKEIKESINSNVNSNLNNFKSAAGNELIDIMSAVMSLEENYEKIILPNTNTILKAEADKLPSNPIASTGLFNPLVSNRVYSDNIESKDGLGIDAKMNTIQKEFQIAGLRYTNTQFASAYLLPQHIQEDGSVALGMQTLTDGTSISRVISEAINGHVDIAKEDWLIMLGLDKVKTPLFHAMILSGTPVVEALEFLNRPIIKYALKEMNRGIIQSELHYTKTVLADRRASNTLRDLLYKFINTDSSAGNKAKDLNLALKMAKKQSTMNNLATAILNYPKFKEAFFSKESSVGKDIASLAMLQNLRERQSKIQQLNSLVDYNTKSYQNSYQKEAEETTYALVRESFNEDGLDILTKRSALAGFNVANTVSGLLDKAFPVSGHRLVFNAINRFADDASLFTQDDLVKAARIVKDNFILATVHLEGKDESGQKLFEKVFGEKGLVAKSNPENLLERFKTLKETYPDIQRNLLVENLYEEKVNVETPYLIFKLKNSNLDKYLVNEYEKAFLKGMNDIRPEVSQFFKDLGIANFMQFGFSNNSKGLTQVTPFEVYVEYTTKAEQSIKEKLKDDGYVKNMTDFLAEMTYINESFDLPHRFFDIAYLKRDYPTVFGNRSNFNIDLVEISENLGQPSMSTTQPSTSVNPLVEAGVKPTDMKGNASKDIQMASESTQFIGFQSGNATVSSTNKYKEAWGDKANTGQYTSNDVVMVSGSGLFRGVTEAQIRETLSNSYKSLLNAAIEAGASFRVGNQYSKGNLSDKLIADYLKFKGYQEEKLDGYSRWSKPQENTNLLGEKITEGVYINQEGLSKDEQLEVFNYLKPFIEEQAAKTNKGANANFMMGLNLRWDYKNNNPNLTPKQIDSIAGNEPYGYYDLSINGKPLGKFTDRLRELITKATGVDVKDYDAAIINLYTPETFINRHPDKSESKTAIKYPVVAVNIGGNGNFNIGDNKGTVFKELKDGAGYSFGFNGVNRTQFHGTRASDIDGFLPEITLKHENITLKEGKYRISVTVRRAMPLEPGMPDKPNTISTQPSVAKTSEIQEQKKQKIISNEDLAYFKTYVDKSKGILPKEFFTSKTRFKEFFNPETGKREPAPQSSKWILNSNNLYDLVDKDGGEVYISNVDLNTGIKYPNTPNNSLGLEEESCDIG